VLRQNGLVERIDAIDLDDVIASPYVAERDAVSDMCNPKSIETYSLALAEKISTAFARGFPTIVLGGDCSILIGCGLALKKRGEYGLVYIDGHADFYRPQESPSGEVADMVLGIVTGEENYLSNIQKRGPYFREENAALFGFRDFDETLRDESRNNHQTLRVCTPH